MDQRIAKLEGRINSLELYKLKSEQIRTSIAYKKRQKQKSGDSKHKDFKKPKPEAEAQENPTMYCKCFCIKNDELTY